MGANPLAKRRADRDGALTLEAAAEKVHAQRVKAWRNGKHQAQWLASLRTYAFPIIGKIPVGEVQSADVLKVLSPIWLTKCETARRVRQRIAAILTWSQVAGHRSPTLVNAAEACMAGLPRQPRTARHHPAVPWPEIPRFLTSVRNCDRQDAGRMALEFLLLTAARTGEVIGATWHEIDLQEATWTIPEGRMKGKRTHRVPLSKQAKQILIDARTRWPHAASIFPNREGGRLSNMALLMLMRRLDRKEVPHGLRSSFRDWAADNRKDRDLAEASLAHALADRTEAAYQRSDLFAARRLLMQSWADFACGG
jgi:integrase